MSRSSSVLCFALLIASFTAIFLILSSSAAALSISTADIKIPYTLNVTYQQPFIICVDIDETGCSFDKQWQYNYSSLAGSLVAYNTLFGNLGIAVSLPNYWCSNITANQTGIVNITANCKDLSGVPLPTASKAFNLTVGNASIPLPIVDNANNFTFGARVGENITIGPYTDLAILNSTGSTKVTDPSGWAAYYTVRNVATGAVVPGFVNKIVQIAGWGPYIDKYNLSSSAPVGIIDFVASNSTQSGGRYIIYKAIPVSAETFTAADSKTTSAAMGQVVRLKANFTIDYGNASAFIDLTSFATTSTVNANLTWPNGTIQNINLSNVSYILNLTPTAPLAAGGYTFLVDIIAPIQAATYAANLTLNHSTSFILKDSATILTRPYVLDMLPSVFAANYTPGASLEVSAAVLDNTTRIATNSSINFTIKDPNATALINFTDNTSTIQSDKWHRINWTIPITAAFGTYSLTINAIDSNNVLYSKTAYFNVSKPSILIYLNVTPAVVSFDITSLLMRTQDINVTNLGATPINIFVSNSSVSSGIKDYVFIDNSSLGQINASKTETFTILVKPNETMENKNYTGTITIGISGTSDTSSVNLTLKVSLFPVIDTTNTTFTVEILTSDIYLDLPIKNSGSKILKNLTYVIITDSDSIIQSVELPANISAGQMNVWTLLFRTLTAKTYSVVIQLSGQDAVSKNISLQLTAFSDFSYTITALQTLIQGIKDNVTALKIKNVAVGDLDTRAEALRSNSTYLKNDLYANKHYSAAYSLLSSLNMSAKTLQAEVNQLAAAANLTQTASGALNQQNQQASPATFDVVLVVVVAIIIIIAAIIIVLSLVPEEESEALPGLVSLRY